ncbi:MAG: hypothetical protein Kow0029_01870 [Candidatus Rifleibacteriota bacterium]
MINKRVSALRVRRIRFFILRRRATNSTESLIRRKLGNSFLIGVLRWYKCRYIGIAILNNPNRNHGLAKLKLIITSLKLPDGV